MDDKVRWGVLGAAKIAVTKVIPGMQLGENSNVTAIASRNLQKAEKAATQLGIPKAYGSYEELLADPEIEAIYNPLPNHLHVPWTIKAAEAGKHVLCEKPISLTAAEAASLLAVRDRTGVKIEEAFMVRTHPQWRATLDLVEQGRIGQVRAVVGVFSYFNRDLENIRNIAEYGGGALMDIGCYLVYGSRIIYGQEPTKVLGLIERDPETRIDSLTSGVMDFPSGHAIFSCSTQMVPYQRVQILGTTGRIEIEIPFNAPPDQPCRIWVDDGGKNFGRDAEIIQFDICDQYTLQGDLFSECIRSGTEPPVSLEGTVQNMAVIEAIFKSAESGQWEIPGVK